MSFPSRMGIVPYNGTMAEDAGPVGSYMLTQEIINKAQYAYGDVYPHGHTFSVLEVPLDRQEIAPKRTWEARLIVYTRAGCFSEHTIVKEARVPAAIWYNVEGRWTAGAPYMNRSPGGAS